MTKTILLTAVISSLLTMGAVLPSKVSLENVRVKVTETTYLPGVPRDRYRLILVLPLE
jgi:hypothetical protein